MFRHNTSRHRLPSDCFEVGPVAVQATIQPIPGATSQLPLPRTGFPGIEPTQPRHDDICSYFLFSHVDLFPVFLPN